VKAQSGYGAGIGGGLNGSGGTVTITGGEVKAQSDYAAGIGEGNNGDIDGKKVTVIPSAGTAIAVAAGDDEGSASSVNGSPFMAETDVTGSLEGMGFVRTWMAPSHVVTVEGGSTSNASAAEGAVVTVTASDPEAGMAFVGWTSDVGVVFTNAVTAETAFTMPATNVTVAAVFKPILIEDIPGQEYTGSAVEPQLVVSCNGSQLVADTDYDVSYLNNTNAETATATVTMRSPRTGSASKTFEIAKAPGLTVSLAGDSFPYDGQPHALSGPATHNAAGGATAIEYSKDLLNWTTDLSSLVATDVADSSTIHVRATNPNYANTATTTAALTITKISVGGGTEEPGGGEVPVGGVSKFDASFVYDGEGHTIDTNALETAFSAAMGDGTGFTYALDDGGVPSATWMSEAPAFTNVGEHVVWYKASNPNYDDFVHAAKVRITKAANAWITEPSMAGWTAGATPATPNKGKAKFGTATVAYGKAGGVAGGLGATRPSAAGSYTATFTVPGTANYGGLSKTVSFTIKPKPTPPKPTPKPKKTFKVKFNANGGTLPKGKKMAAQTFTTGKAKKLRGNAFVRDGWIFLGWSTRKNGPVAYKNGQKVKNIAKAGKSVTLYAVWAKETYEVAFDASGGRLPRGVKMPRQTFTYGESQNLRKNKFIRKGYVFGGWAISDPLATIPKVAYKNGQKIKNLTTDGRTVRLYAVWKRR
jgi:uncharacterized repeat protein (TIGR02543 family)